MLCFVLIALNGQHARAAPVGVLRHLSTEDGLPQNWIRALAQTDDRMLWVGTSSGLMRYDGVELAEVEPLAGQKIEQLMLGGEGQVWINSSDGLWRADGERITLVQAYARGQPRYLIEDTDGALWHQRGEALVRLSAPAAAAVPLPEACQALNARPIRLSFRCGAAGLFQLSGGAVAALAGVDGAPLQGTMALSDSRGVLWVSSDDGVQRYLQEPSGHRPVALPGGEHLGGGIGLELRSGAVWLTSDDGDVYAWDGAALRQRAALGRSVTAMLEDASGTVWVGTRGGGLYQLAARQVLSVLREELPDPLAWTAHEDDSGRRWLATESGLALQHGDSARVVTDETVYALYPEEGGLWLGMETGLGWWDGAALRRVPSAHPIRGGILRDSRGTLWAGGAWGLWRLSGEVLEAVALPFPIGTRYPAVGGIVEDARGLVWFATDAGLLVHDGEGWARRAEGHFRGLSIDDEGAIWATRHGGGLVRARGEAVQALGPERGLPESTLHAVTFDELGFVWLSSNRGLFRARQEALRRALDDPGAAVRLQAFGAADGLRSLEFNSGFPPSARVGGELWFPSTQGFVRADPAQVARSTSAPVPRIRSVLVDTVAVHDWAGLSLPPHARAISVAWSAPDLLSGRGMAYRYMLRGHDEDWLEVGGRRQASWSNLPPGAYELRLQATSADGVRSADDATLAFVVEARLYQEPWFVVLVLLLGGGLVLAGHRYRLRVLRERELAVLVAQRTAALQAARAHSEQQARELERLSAIKTRFFANVSHELRTPLSLIVGPVEGAIADGQPLGGAALQRLSRSAQRLRALIDELLDIARLDAGQLPLYAAEGDLAALLEARAALFRPLAARQGVQIRVQAEPLVAWFDRERLQKVLDNLLSNALRYTDDGGTVTLSVERQGGCARLSVADDGVGIAAAHLPHIFERFYQIPTPGAQPSGSSGIGLSFCQELVARHGGTLTAESTLGAGSRFTVTLPLGRDHLSAADIVSAPEATAQAALLPAAAAGEDATVLIVEDSADMRSWLRQVLAQRFAVIEAADGAAGLELAQTLIPDAVVSDVMMPGMDGMALCRALREDARTSHLPVILLTARASEECRLESLEHGADAHIGKPFRPRELMVTLDNLLRARESLQARHRQELLLEAADVEAPSADTVFLRRVREACEANIESEGFGVTELAAQMSMSRRQLGRKISSLTGEPPSALLRRIRLHRARSLLEQSAGNVSEIAYRVGYSKPSRFSAHFRAEFGVTPSSVLRRG